MRKQYKLKKRSCKMCKPHKMGWDKRWGFRDVVRMQAARQEVQDVENETHESKESV
jgi:hypothetical protein